VKIDINQMTADGRGCWQQTLVWLHQGKLRTEIFCGRTLQETESAISERIAEIEKFRSQGPDRVI
jgi:hypothetical protein